MIRRERDRRPRWEERVEAEGLIFHSLVGQERRAYWGEGAYYALRGAEVDRIARATGEIHAMCLKAAETVIAQRRYAELGVPEQAIPLIERSWEEEPPAIYGRLDLALASDGTPKLLEYNADTPTSLLEAAVIQWSWLMDCFPERDQFNAIHDRLVDTWRDVAGALDGSLVHFGYVPELEDEMTIGYLRDTAGQAGLESAAVEMERIGWDARSKRFVDPGRRQIRNLFKLYPWEDLIADPFGAMIPQAPALRWIEPAWKMLLASKGILALLWELFPGHPNLLPAALDAAALDADRVVRKPLHGREGSNVTIRIGGEEVSTGGPYADDRFVFQEYVDLGCYGGMRPVLGSWLIGGESCGLGIRETEGLVTDDTARFVPHLIEG